MNRLIQVVVLSCLCVGYLASTVSGQSDVALQRRIDQLIVQLGDAEFAERESATSELLVIGEPALAQLRGVSKSASFEVRHRAELLRDRIEKDKFARLSTSFLLDLDGDNSYGLPAWSAYRELVGASRTSKLLFLKMIREQPEVAQLIELATGSDASPAARNALAALAAKEATLIRENLYSLVEPEIGDVVGMLVVASILPVQTPIEISDVIVINEHRAFGGNIHKQGFGNCLRKLIAAWLPKTHDGLAPAAMEIALRYDLSEGAEIARRHLTPNFDSDTRKIAFYCLARFGDETDIARILPLLDDMTVVDEFARSNGADGIHESNSAPPGAAPRERDSQNNMVVRINDLALTTIMLLSHQDPTIVFTGFESHPQLGFFVHSLASPSGLSDERKQRIDLWKKEHLPGHIES